MERNSPQNDTIETIQNIYENDSKMLDRILNRQGNPSNIGRRSTEDTQPLSMVMQ